MKKLISYIFLLAILLSLVHVTKEVISFSKEIILLKDQQTRAGIKEERMLQPAVKLSSILLEENALPEDEVKGSILLSSATGFSLKYNPSTNTSLIITNEHFCRTITAGVTLILENYEKSILELSDDYMDSKVIYSDATLDLCLVEAKGFIKPVVIADCDYEAVPFEKVYVVGGPSGNFPIIFDSYISSIVEREDITLGAMDEEGHPFLLISEQVFPGHSGSPVFTEEGEVIGMIFGALETYGGLAISNKDICDILESLEDTGQSSF
jgi:S1-C subfamily serine protease